MSSISSTDQYLLAISVGPVQDFIKAARRTRDLWFGSHMLSELSKAAARGLLKQGEAAGGEAQLIFPAPGKGDLAAGSDFNVGNVILAEVHGAPPEDFIESAKAEVHNQWRAFSSEAFESVSELVDSVRWEVQTNPDDVVEFYAAAVPSRGDYVGERRRLMRLLAGRKALRDFAQDAGDDRGIPKSSLDGARASVWRNWSPEHIAGQNNDPGRSQVKILQGINADQAKKLRIQDQEQLDAIGVVKRVAGTQMSFPSVTRVAVDPWLRGAQMAAPDAVESLCKLCKSVDVDGITTNRFQEYKAFPFNGTVVLPDRLHDVENEILSRTDKAQSEVSDVFRQIREVVKQLCDQLGEPEPYLAILAADGDRMGAALSQLSSPETHRKFSKKLAGFASRARDIVRSHRGAPVYTGGDDVLAFVPVDQAISCARALAQEFAATMKIQGVSVSPTLSVGLAIGHCMEPLEDLLDLAREAEREAKAKNSDRPGDGLAVHVHARGGTPIKVREQNNDGRLARWTDLLIQGAIPDKAAFDLRLLARQYLNPDGTLVPGLGDNAELLRRDAIRLLRRKGGGGNGTALSEMAGQFEDLANARDLLRITDELLVARRIARSMQQAVPDSAVGAEREQNTVTVAGEVR